MNAQNTKALWCYIEQSAKHIRAMRCKEQLRTRRVLSNYQLAQKSCLRWMKKGLRFIEHQYCRCHGCQ